MRTNFDRAFPLTLKYEGGYVDDRDDPGGATNLGVTIGTLSSHLGRPATKAEVRALTPAKVKPIYQRRYWDKVAGDQLPPGVDFAVYDFAVNSGPARAAKALQAALGVKQDGVIGDDTLLALKAHSDAAALVEGVCAQRLAFVRRLGTFRKFGRGWTDRIDHVKKVGLSWAAEHVTPTVAAVVAAATVDHSADAPLAPGRALDKDQALSKTPEIQAAVTAAIGAAGVAATQAAAHADVPVIKYVSAALAGLGIAASAFMAYHKARSES